jgi:hypothetical protein
MGRRLWLVIDKVAAVGHLGVSVFILGYRHLGSNPAGRESP